MFTLTGTNTAGSDTKSTVLIFKLPKPAPTVQIIAPSNGFRTTSKTTTLKATLENVPSKSNTSIKVNGQPLSNFTLSGTKLTASGINLREGNNKIVIQASTASGTASKSVTVIRQVLPPVVTVTSPSSNPARSEKATTNVTANITNARRNEIQFIVNGKAYSNFVMKGSLFTASNVPLRVGNNTLSFKVNTAGGVADKSWVVVYQPPVQKPAIALLPPTKATMNVEGVTTSINLKASVENVANKSGIAVSLNGQMYSNITLSGTTLNIANVPLKTGNNTISIRVTNSAGTATQNIVVVRAPNLPASKPTIANLKVTNTEGKGNLVTNIAYVSDESKITVKVNDQIVKNFNFTKNTLTATGLTLKEGTNVFTVTAVNERGTTTQSATLNGVSTNRKAINPSSPTMPANKNGGRSGEK